MKPVGGVAVLCDFDGTLTSRNVMDFLYQRFAACGMTYAEQWEHGEISTPEEMRLTFATVHASRQEMETELAGLEVDPGLPELVGFCQERGYPLGVVSDGLEWYIRFLLQLHGAADLPVYANRLLFGRSGFRLEFPWYDKETPKRGVCKPKIVRSFRESGFKVAFVGDGLSDVDAVTEADRVYARAGLLAHCRAQGIPAIAFGSLSDLVRRWQDPAPSSSSPRGQAMSTC